MIMANEQAGQKKQANAEVNARLTGEEQSVIAGQEDRSRKWSQLVAQAWADEKLKQRLTDSPSAVLQEHGIEVPTGVEIRVVESTDKICYLTLPAKPSDELTPSQLQGVAGGSFMTTVKLAAQVAILAGPPPTPVTPETMQQRKDKYGY
jgi:hypothetical protein